MDGLEWKRSKYSPAVKQFLQYAEKMAVRFSRYHIADSLPIQKYLKDKYQAEATYISYGADLPGETGNHVLSRYGLQKDNYFLLIARMEPENNIETILDGICKNHSNKKILVVGNTANGFGKKMVAKFKEQSHVYFAGTIYDSAELNALRGGCLLYFHGHSVGGTNPSLLEAMAAGALICAHDNEFNRAVLEDNAFYFSSPEEVAVISSNVQKKEIAQQMIIRNLEKIRMDHSWQKIVAEYENLFIQCYQSAK